jgi:hypothetical protein
MDFKAMREAVITELFSVEHNISAKKREIEVLWQKVERLNRKLFEINELEALRADMGLTELLRLCQTPCGLFEPVELDLALETVKAYRKD